MRLGGDIAAQVWLRDYLFCERDVGALRQRLLLPGAGAPAEFAARVQVVCSCFDVAEAEVQQVLAGGGDNALVALRHLQQRLRCGTNGGSCLPELRRLAADVCRLRVEAKVA